MPEEISLTPPTYPDGQIARVANGEGFDARCLAGDGEYRCSYPAGHARLTTGGDTYAHASVDDDGALIVAWNPPAPPLADTADPGYAERLAKLRERCQSTAPTDPTAQCVRPAGHDGLHAPRAQLANGTVRWADADPTEAHPGDSDTEAVRRLIERAMESGKVKVFTNAGDAGPCRRHPAPVRVRFVDLPHRHTERVGPLGITGTATVPGGFALVVDRFKHLAHLDAEGDFWQRFGADVGAVRTLLYPGELDITGW